MAVHRAVAPLTEPAATFLIVEVPATKPALIIGRLEL